MRNKVIKPFIDAETKARYNAGSFYETADDKRIAFLEQRGFIAPGEEPATNNEITQEPISPDEESPVQDEEEPEAKPDEQPKPSTSARKRKPKE